MRTKSLTTLSKLALVACLTGCASPGADALRSAYFEGHYAEASVEAEKRSADDQGNAHLWALQKSLVDLAQADPRKAVRSLGVAKEGVLERTSYASKSFLSQALDNASAMFSDDNALEYGGRDYEHLMMYSLLTLGELLKGRRGDEMAYGFQGLDRVIEAIDAFEDPDGNNPKKDYKIVPFGEYLRAAFYEETPSRISDTRRAYNRFHELVGDFPYAEQDKARLAGDIRKGEGMGVVHLFSFVGEGPNYHEDSDFASAAVIQWAQVFVRASRGAGVKLPNLGAIKTASLDQDQYAGFSSRVRVDGEIVGQTGVVANLWDSAQAEQAAMRDTQILRAVLRRVFKALATEAIDNQIEDQRLSFVARALGSVWTATEKADLRGWSLLPSTVQALRIELPPGPHRIEVQALDPSGRPVGAPQISEVNVHQIYQSYVLGLLPCSASGGSIMSSSPVAPEIEP